VKEALFGPVETMVVVSVSDTKIATPSLALFATYGFMGHAGADEATQLLGMVYHAPPDYKNLWSL